MTSVTATVASFAARTPVPDDLLDRARNELASIAALAVEGTPSAPVVAALDAAGAGSLAALPQGAVVSVPDAALLMASTAAQQMTSDTARSIVAVIAAVAGASEHQQVPGSHGLEAMAVGSEIAVRIVDVLRGSGYHERGWDLVGAAGSIGAAVGVGRAIGSSDDVIGRSVGVAATQAAGLTLAPRELAAWSVGKAAANGVESALLCAAGFSGPREGLEGRRGLFAVAAPESDPSELIDGLGEQWRSRDADEIGDAPPADHVRAAVAAAVTGSFERFSQTVRG